MMNYYGGYQPGYLAPGYQAPKQQTSSLIWVQGENGAKAYLVAPNTTVMLLDSEGDKFYLKSADASGMPMPLRTFEYKETTQNAEKSAVVGQEQGYVTRGEFDALKRAVEGLVGGNKDEQSV